MTVSLNLPCALSFNTPIPRLASDGQGVSPEFPGEVSSNNEKHSSKSAILSEKIAQNQNMRIARNIDNSSFHVLYEQALNMAFAHLEDTSRIRVFLAEHPMASEYESALYLYLEEDLSSSEFIRKAASIELRSHIKEINDDFARRGEDGSDPADSNGRHGIRTRDMVDREITDTENKWREIEAQGNTVIPLWVLKRTALYVKAKQNEADLSNTMTRYNKLETLLNSIKVQIWDNINHDPEAAHNRSTK